MDDNNSNNFLDTVETTLGQVQNKLGELTSISQSAKEIESSIIDSQAKINNTILENTKQLESILSESQAKHIVISSISDNAKIKEQEVNNYHTRIIELKASSESNSDHVTNLYNEIINLKQQIDKINLESIDNNRNITSLEQDGSRKMLEIDKFYSEFQILKDKIDNVENGMSATLNKAQDILDQTSKAKEDAQKYKDDAENIKEDVLKNKVQLDEIVSSSFDNSRFVKSVLDESEQLKRKIGQILDLVRDTGLANSFDKRRKRSQRSLYVWGGVIFIGILISIFLINSIFLSDKSNSLFSSVYSDYVKFLLRITLTSPGIFAIWFGASQYSKERYFLEQYEFKTAAALALENYTQLIKQNYPTQTQELFNLNIELIKSVYKEPEYFKPKNGFSAKFKIPKINTEVETQINSEVK